MRLIAFCALLMFILSACSDTRVQVKGGSKSAPKWKISKPI